MLRTAFDRRLPRRSAAVTDAIGLIAPAAAAGAGAVLPVRRRAARR
jgi:hypothetical protein